MCVFVLHLEKSKACRWVLTAHLLDDVGRRHDALLLTDMRDKVVGALDANGEERLPCLSGRLHPHVLVPVLAMMYFLTHTTKR